MRFPRFPAVAALALLAPLALAACASPPVQGTGVVTGLNGQPAGQAVMTVEQDVGWPTPLAVVTLPDGEQFRGKVIHERTEPEAGFALGTGFGWGSRRGVGYGTGVLFEGPERTSRAGALLIGDRGRSMTCDIRTAAPGRISSGGYADCKVSDGRVVALQF